MAERIAELEAANKMLTEKVNSLSKQNSHHLCKMACDAYKLCMAYDDERIRELQQELEKREQVIEMLLKENNALKVRQYM
jgi:hypothetical protein